jgi:Rhodopirellula transposase DDE domain
MGERRISTCKAAPLEIRKYSLYQTITRVHGLIITVCHCPPGASKWNPVEHRLFSFISLEWAGHPFRSLQLMMSYIGGRATEAEPCRPVPNGVVFAR